MKMLSIVFVLTLGLAGCKTPRGPDDPHPVTDTDWCDDAEKRLLELPDKDPQTGAPVVGCRDRRGELLGGKNKSGETFTQRCMESHKQNIWMNPKCLASLTSCDKKERDACLSQ